MYKLKDGDIIKLLPIIDKTSKFNSFVDVTATFLDNKMIYDTGNYLKRIADFHQLSYTKIFSVSKISYSSDTCLKFKCEMEQSEIIVNSFSKGMGENFKIEGIYKKDK